MVVAFAGNKGGLSSLMTRVRFLALLGGGGVVESIRAGQSGLDDFNLQSS